MGVHHSFATLTISCSSFPVIATGSFTIIDLKSKGVGFYPDRMLVYQISKILTCVTGNFLFFAWKFRYKPQIF